MSRTLIGILLLSLTSQLSAEELIDYRRQIRPLLSNSCYACHGPDRANQENDLRLDVRDHAITSAISPGNADESEIIRRLLSEDEERMPPSDSTRTPLTPEQVALVKKWIDQGANFSEHWSYSQPDLPSVPATESRWALNPIDHFVVEQNASRSMDQAPDASPRVLIRRLYFDLLGLPPTPEQVRRFEENATQETYAKIVDELLSSDHYGERMAAFWLDLVRFADTCGYHGDQHREIAAYRTFVIEAFNENLPFDRFTVAQLAGDLLPSPTTQDLVASGYNRLLQTTQEGGAQAKEYRAIYAADRVRNVSTVWLGSTLGCAQCHDHKFDPFSAEDFYRFAAFFDDIEEAAVGHPSPNFELPTAKQQERLAELDRKIEELKTAVQAAESEEPQNAEKIEKSKQELKSAEENRNQVNGQVIRTLITKTSAPRMTRILPRGNWLDESGAVVEPGVPVVLGTLTPPDEGTANRLDLARWIVSSENPLTARVFVNHVWRLMFGEGLVRTPDDFGSQGTFPTHPELLDWLACQFVDSDWNVKHLVKLIVTSRTYQQSSRMTAELRVQDLNNEWLTRQNRFRLEAEMIRDNALTVAGLLTSGTGGPSVKPYQPAGYWAELNFPKRKYQADSGANQYRRGVYTYWCRTFLHPSLAAFDAPTREECTAQRTRSNTPLQALVLLNDPTYVEAAKYFAKRITGEAGETDQEKLNWAFQEILARRPNDVELGVLRNVLDEQRKRYQSDTEGAAQISGETKEDANVAELAAWTAISRVLLNLHETITRY